jgi:hypothetical protein
MFGRRPAAPSDFADFAAAAHTGCAAPATANINANDTRDIRIVNVL